MPRLILIVDDRPDDILLAETALSMLDPEIRTESASTGEQALGFLEAARELPALILLDLKMPGMGGIETLRRIRADERWKNIPVIVVTCSTLESDMIEARAAGATGFVQKAIRLNQFRKDLEYYIRRWTGK